MSKGRNTPNISGFAGAIRGVAKGIVDDQPTLLDFGEIRGDKSLLTNRFGVPIPKDDYVICRGLAHGALTTTSAEGHAHRVTIPKVKPGDRVLVAWVDDDAVIIDVILNADEALS